MPKIALEEKKMEALVGRAVQRVILGILEDPDRGQELSEQFKKRLKKSAVSARRGFVRDFDDVISSLPK